MKTVALISQVWRGHVPSYAKHYSAAFRSQGFRVLEITPPTGVSASGAKNGAVFRRLLQRLLKQVGVFKCARTVRWWLWAERELARAEKEARGKIDGVFFTYLDLHFLDHSLPLGWIDRRVRRPWAGVLLHPAAVYGVAGKYVGGERILASKTCRAVVVVDDSFVAPCVTAWPGRLVVPAPELADVSPPNAMYPPAKEILSWAAGRKVVGLLGVLSGKKGVSTYIEIARQAADKGKPIAFIIAGDFSPAASGPNDYAALTETLRNLPQNCQLWAQAIPDGPEFNALVQCCDIVYLAYRPAPEKSNVLTKAAFFRRPAIVSEGHLMAVAAREFALGEVVQFGDVSGAENAIDRILATRGRRRFSDYYALNSIERLNSTITQVSEAFFG